MLDGATHVLVAGDYADALGAVVAETLTRVEDAYVLLDYDELDEGFDPAVTSCERWRAVRDGFEPIDGPGPFPGEAVDTVTTDQHTFSGRRAVRLVGDPAALERLCTLAGEPVVGQWFLQQVRLTAGGDAVLGAVPHHRELAIDGEPLGGRFLDAVSESLADYRGCLVPAGTRMEWSAGGRSVRLAGPSLCVEHGNGLAGRACWGLAQLDSVRREGSELVLTWEPDGRSLPVRTLIRGLSAVLPGASRPERIPCGTPETAERAHDLLAETLAAYEPAKSGP